MSQPAIKERAKSDLSPANYMCVCRPTPVPAFRMARLAARSPQNILVTGGCGFIASHVVILLVNKYPQYKVHAAATHRHACSSRLLNTTQIVCLDKMDYCSSLRNLDAVKDRPNFKFIKGNILSTDLVACACPVTPLLLQLTSHHARQVCAGD